MSLRRQEYDEYLRQEQPADRFETRGIVYHGNRFTGGGRPSADGDLRRGIGCGPGVASGRARIVMDPAAPSRRRRRLCQRCRQHLDPPVHAFWDERRSVEPAAKPTRAEWDRLKSKLAWAHIEQVLVLPRIPVDRRHNAKVDYPELERCVLNHARQRAQASLAAFSR